MLKEYEINSLNQQKNPYTKELKSIYEQAKEVFTEISGKADIKMGNLMVVGCSTSTVLGDMPGMNSSEDTAEELYKALIDVFGGKFDIAIQCCEHLNRALVIEREVAERYGFEIVNAVPYKKGGGAFATKHYYSLKDAVVVESVNAKAVVGIDIGGVMVGMHLKPVVVPMKLQNRHIGEAFVLAGTSRLKYIGGERARYL